MPVINAGVELDAGIGASPGRIGHLVPQIASLERLGGLAVAAIGELPVAVFQHRLQEGVGDPYRVVRILPCHRSVGFAVPVGVVGAEVHLLVALARETDDPLDQIVGDHALAGCLDLAAQRRVLQRIIAIAARAFAIDAGLQHRLEMAFRQLGAGDQGCDLLFFNHFPIDEVLDIGMVDIHDHHFGGTARGAARLDGAGGAVADFQEAHQAGRFTAARQPFVGAAQGREIGARARTVFEQTRFARPQIHDAAFIDQIVLDALDEAGMGLGMFVGGRGFCQPAALVIDIVMALAGTIDAIGPVQAGVEPLWRVGRAFLRRQHVAEFVIEGAGVGLGVEIAAFPAPIGPGACHTVEHLLGGFLAGCFLAVLGRLTAPEEFRHAFLRNRLEGFGDARLAEVFLRQHIAGHLAPAFRHLDVGLGEHDRAVGVPDFAGGVAERDAFVR